MRDRLLWLTSLALLVSVGPGRASGQDPAPASEQQGPRLEVVGGAGKVFELGRVVLGSILESTITVKNVGDAPLELKKAEGSCSCSVGKLPKATIPPGEQGEIGISYDSSERGIGRRKFTVDLHSNDPTQRDRGPFVTTLECYVDVETYIERRPFGVYFGEFQRGQEARTQVVRLSGKGPAKDGFSAKLAGELPPWISTEIEPLAEERAKGVLVKVTLAAEAPLGELTYWLEVETTVPDQPRYRLPISGIVVGPYRYENLVQIPRALAGTEFTSQVTISRPDGRPLGIEGLEFDRRLFKAELKPANPSRTQLEIKVRADAPLGLFAREVRVLTADPAEPLISIMVLGRVNHPVEAMPPSLRLEAGGRQRVRLFSGRPQAARVQPRRLAKLVSARLVPGGVELSCEEAIPADLPRQAAQGVLRVEFADAIPLDIPLRLAAQGVGKK